MMQTRDVERVLDALVEHIKGWLDGGRHGQVSTSPSPREIRMMSRLLPPLEGEGIEGVLQGMDEALRHSVKTHHSGFMNPLWGGFSLSGFAGEVISSLAQTSMYTFELAPFASMVEQAVIRRMCEIAGFSDGNGTLTTGGSNGNLLGVLCARHALQSTSSRSGFDGRDKVILV